MSLPPAVYGRQYDAKYVAFEYLSQAAFVADTIWGVQLEPARTLSTF